ncbi:F510_1955 family glycosylhydrolase [Arthrobacter sulfonylureivorans]|uniref:F510_1955 family glycosylhydrolase n=1 Tax=Arthrobacter sulfonylureivorans TaxID=2486855 RepID=UPI0039E657A5
MPAAHVKTTTTRTLRALAAVAAVALLAACGPTQPAAPPAATAPANPYGHIHGMTVDPDTGHVLLATHNGLFNATASPVEQISPTIDLMGFATTADPGHYYASGHPGPGSDLPDPVGLIHSNDGGETWEPLSRQGESDFHAMTSTRDGIIGYDGQIRRTKDGRSWTTIKADFQPFALAGSPTGAVVLATTEQGLQRSGNGGTTWEQPANAPLLVFTAFADSATVAGVATDNTVHISRDAGRTWQPRGSVSGQPAAIAATAGNGSEEATQIWVATTSGLEHSQDNGATFTPVGNGNLP